MNQTLSDFKINPNAYRVPTMQPTNKIVFDTNEITLGYDIADIEDPDAFIDRVRPVIIKFLEFAKERQNNV